ncbi:MAG: 2-hydroxyacyl-CoA dehydratase family protein, partial [Planctomycetota bacterium]|nr:2-hydroxyacyl-CoA dehydratase family protein [Planctomycetota bacterium]
MPCALSAPPAKSPAAIAAAVARLRQRPDSAPVFAPFLEALARLASPSLLQAYIGRPLAAYYCAQTPVELLRALDYHPFPLHALAFAEVQRFSTALSPLACPLANACFAACQEIIASSLCEIAVIPAACDWAARAADWLHETGAAVHIMEVPRQQRSAPSQRRWRAEVEHLRAALERRRGCV